MRGSDVMASASSGERDSMPSTATPSAMRSSMSAAAGMAGISSFARRRTWSVISSSRHGGAYSSEGWPEPSSVVSSRERWSATENQRICSTSSPKNSMRTG